MTRGAVADVAARLVVMLVVAPRPSRCLTGVSYRCELCIVVRCARAGPVDCALRAMTGARSSCGPTRTGVAKVRVEPVDVCSQVLLRSLDGQSPAQRAHACVFGFGDLLWSVHCGCGLTEDIVHV